MPQSLIIRMADATRRDGTSLLIALKTPEIIHTMVVLVAHRLMSNYSNCEVIGCCGFCKLVCRCSGQLSNLPERGLWRFFVGQRRCMAEIVNLRAARKRASRQRSEKRAAEARVSHGMSKADRALARSNSEKIRRELDEHRIETGEADEIAGR